MEQHGYRRDLGRRRGLVRSRSSTAGRLPGIRDARADDPNLTFGETRNGLPRIDGPHIHSEVHPVELGAPAAQLAKFRFADRRHERDVQLLSGASEADYRRAQLRMGGPVARYLIGERRGNAVKVAENANT